MDTYERTYSQSLGQPLDNLRGPSTTNDYAIALALAGVSEEERGGPDTSLDSELAHALYEREASKLLRLPSRKVRRRSRALRKLLHYLKPTEVIPRLNPQLPPTPGYEAADRSRLLLRLDMYGLQERVVKGDGNCQFRALADQLYYKEDRHADVRQAVVDQLCCFAERYQAFVPMDYKEYVGSMSKLGTWGDHVTLQAAADAYHVGICVVTSFLDNCVISISPIIDEQQPPDPRQITQHNQQLKQQQEQSASGPQEHAMQQLQQAPAGTQELQQIQQPASPVVDECITLWLSFWAEVHYNSLAPKASADSSMDSEGGSSSEEEGAGSHKFLGSSRLGKLFG